MGVQSSMFADLPAEAFDEPAKATADVNVEQDHDDGHEHPATHGHETDSKPADDPIHITLRWMTSIHRQRTEGPGEPRVFELTLPHSQVVHDLWDRLREVLKDAGLYTQSGPEPTFHVENGARTIRPVNGNLAPVYATMILDRPTNKDTHDYVLHQRGPIVINAVEREPDYC